MQFTNINFWSVLLFITISLTFGILLWLFFVKREKLRKKYVLLFNQNKLFYLKYVFLFFSLLILSLQIFHLNYLQTNSKKVSQLDMVFVLDVSKSMDSLDYDYKGKKVSRLDFSKETIKKYVNSNSTNRYGLVIFSGDAISLLPVSSDLGAFLNALENSSNTNLTKGGSNFREAVKLGYSRLNWSGNENKNKLMILLTDGGDENSNSPLDPSLSGTIEEINVIVLGVGKEKGVRIPDGKGGYKKYLGGYVTTKLNTKFLLELSKTLNGTYKPLLDNLQLESEDLKENIAVYQKFSQKKDFGRMLAILSLIFFILYLFFNAKNTGKK